MVDIIMDAVPNLPAAQKREFQSFLQSEDVKNSLM